jgi:hypothetical protein
LKWQITLANEVLH